MAADGNTTQTPPRHIPLFNSHLPAFPSTLLSLLHVLCSEGNLILPPKHLGIGSDLPIFAQLQMLGKDWITTSTMPNIIDLIFNRHNSPPSLLSHGYCHYCLSKSLNETSQPCHTAPPFIQDVGSPC
ncbi:uncharacterized protein LACBIDRAFT_331523 [Laccaria bicolor S238N-H82]|uniref:Predicted protein n=1 Tax=Laccaria bicolor (strain S238N-H82 / ATCC MYA-4686) TaxID=486041 RepID=B0DPQ7_LACBS|nr:uncharacterized protein LACBIDRAFT_331523 [Laccaria bicolor S238N-H82]EDR03490.1 predicted protein [Laccaria bicolor S238N-H82]|eukprot:XP_001885946.1 predicted protein [Laccaria bicolor S238N-H82]